MKTPLYEALNGGRNNNSFMSSFQQFAQNFQGDPRAQIQQMLNSGRITQQQYDQAVNVANRMINSDMAKMFGIFK